MTVLQVIIVYNWQPLRHLQELQALILVLVQNSTGVEPESAWEFLHYLVIMTRQLAKLQLSQL